MDFPWPLSLPQLCLLVALATFVSVLVAALLRPSKYPTVRGPRGLPLLGCLIPFLRQGPFRCFKKWSEEYGSVFKLNLGLREVLVLTDPELCKEVGVRKFKSFRNRQSPAEFPRKMERGILLSKDKYWSMARGAVLPWVHQREHLAEYLGLMGEHLGGMCQELALLKPGESVDVSRRLQTLTLDVFCSAAFGGTLDDKANTNASEVSRMVAQSTRLLGAPSLSSVLGLFVPGWAARAAHSLLSHVPGTVEAMRSKVLLRRERIGELLILQRLKEEAEGQENKDVLSQLLRAEKKGEGQQVKLSHNEHVYILGELIVAGSDTTANTITFAIFLLSTHPEAQAKLLAEIDALADSHPPTSLENLGKYLYTEMVVKETLRMFPVASQTGREASEDVHVGGVRVPRGSGVILPIWVMHMCHKYFPDPESFRPERFEESSPGASENNMNAYMPFGLGPRMCLGNKFAMLEAVCALIAFYRRFTFQTAGELAGLLGKDAVSKIPVASRGLLKPAHGLPVYVTKRN